jgi:hypothetical protein
MPELKNYAEQSFHETRILILGGDILLGYTFRMCFEPGYMKLSHANQMVGGVLVAVSILALNWLLIPASAHIIADGTNTSVHASERNRFILVWGLLPIALGVGADIYLAALGIKLPGAYWLGIIFGGLALAAWYVASWVRYRKGRKMKVTADVKEQEKTYKTETKEKVSMLLLEARMILPGVQAFLGFQLATVFMASFAKLPKAVQWAHFGSLSAVAVSVILTIAPASYHRVAESGEDSEHFVSIGSGMLVTALLFLGVGMAADLYVVLFKLEQVEGLRGEQIAMWSGIAVLVISYAMWFGYSVVDRARERRHRLATA